MKRASIAGRPTLFCADSHFSVTPKAGEKADKHRLTQLGRAGSTGGETIPAYSPQARGRSKRSLGKWQGLLQEERLAGIDTAEGAKRSCATATSRSPMRIYRSRPNRKKRSFPRRRERIRTVSSPCRTSAWWPQDNSVKLFWTFTRRDVHTLLADRRQTAGSRSLIGIPQLGWAYWPAIKGDRLSRRTPVDNASVRQSNRGHRI